MCLEVPERQPKIILYEKRQPEKAPGKLDLIMIPKVGTISDVYAVDMLCTQVEDAMGDGVKRVTESEKKNLMVARKSLVASRKIKRGDLFSADNITAKRPATGISPMLLDDVIGRKAQRDFDEDDLIVI